MSGSMLKDVDFSCSQERIKNEMEDKMKILMDKNMEEFQNSMSTFPLHTLDDIFSQVDMRTQGNHVKLEEINIEPKNHDYSSLKIHIFIL
jgi:hypothetical protein